MEVAIIKREPVGEKYPRFFYRTVMDGQGEYVRRQCKEKGISAVTMNREVAIYSKKKLAMFSGIIKESLEKSEVPQPVLEQGSLLAKNGATILGVFLVKDDGVHLFVTEKHFPDVKINVFAKRLPRYYFCHLFNSHKEFMHHVQEVEMLAI